MSKTKIFFVGIIIFTGLFIFGKVRNHSEIGASDLIPINTTHWTEVPVEGPFDVKIIGDLKWRVVINKDFENPKQLPTPDKIFDFGNGVKTLDINLNSGQGVDNANVRYVRK